MIGSIVSVMVLFCGLTLVILFTFHSILTAIYAFTEWTHIPFLVLLAWPVWLMIPAILTMRGIRALLKYIA